MQSRRFALVLLVLSLLACVSAAQVSAQSPPSKAEPKAAAARADVQVVDLNRATVAELETVPGIGSSLARRIVDFREKNGPFARVDDLIKVQGIGEKSLRKLSPYLTISKAK